MNNGKSGFISDLVQFLMSSVRQRLHFINGAIGSVNTGDNYRACVIIWISVPLSWKESIQNKQDNRVFRPTHLGVDEHSVV